MDVQCVYTTLCACAGCGWFRDTGCDRTLHQCPSTLNSRLSEGSLVFRGPRVAFSLAGFLPLLVRRGQQLRVVLLVETTGSCCSYRLTPRIPIPTSTEDRWVLRSTAAGRLLWAWSTLTMIATADWLRLSSAKDSTVVGGCKGGKHWPFLLLKTRV